MGAIRVWQSVSRDRILLDNENFNWFYDISVNSSYFRLKICIYVAMNVKNIIYKASFGRTCSNYNPRANNISVSHCQWPGDDCTNLKNSSCFYHSRTIESQLRESEAVRTIAWKEPHKHYDRISANPWIARVQARPSDLFMLTCRCIVNDTI